MALDKDGYPDEQSLEQITKWNLQTQDIYGLLDLIEENTQYADRQIEITGKRVIRFTYHTGGWSGNEDVIEALHSNILFWSLFWYKSGRGGHFYFKIPHPEWYPLKDKRNKG